MSRTIVARVVRCAKRALCACRNNTAECVSEWDTYRGPLDRGTCTGKRSHSLTSTFVFCINPLRDGGGADNAC